MTYKYALVLLGRGMFILTLSMQPRKQAFLYVLTLALYFLHACYPGLSWRLGPLFQSINRGQLCAHR